jgi:hypothetical protein
VAKQFSDDDLKQYVLGELAEAEQARLEEAYFDDDALYERVLAVEEEVAEELARGELAPEARLRFEERIRSSSALAERAGFVRTFVAALDEPEHPLDRAAEPAGTWLSRILEVLGVRGVGFALAAAAVALLALGWLWLAREGSQPSLPPPDTTSVTPPEPPPVEPPDGPAVPAPPAPAPETPRAAVATFVLTPGVSRSGGAPTAVRVPGGTQSVRLRLPLEDVAAGDLTSVLKSQDGRVVWRAERVRARRVAEVTIPARLLANGSYVLALERTTAEGDRETVEAYSFAVRRQ